MHVELSIYCVQHTEHVDTSKAVTAYIDAAAQAYHRVLWMFMHLAVLGNIQAHIIYIDTIH
jgi:hypothetical protein